MQRVTDLFYALDAGYSGCTMVSVFSAAEHASRPITVTLLVDYDPELAKKQFAPLSAHEKISELRIWPLTFAPEVEAKIGAFPRAVVGRLLAPSFFDGRAIYLDGDTLVLSDLTELLAIDLDDKPIGAVHDTMMLGWRAKSRSVGSRRGTKYCDMLKNHGKDMPGFDPEAYFNSGVLLLDFDRIRLLGLAGPMGDVLTARRYRYPDQDHLNLVFNGEVLWIDPVWNSQWSNIEMRRRYHKHATRLRFSRSHQNPHILHYVGPKPWASLDRKHLSKMLGFKTLPELPSVLHMRSVYASWRAAAKKFCGIDPFNA